MINRYKIINKTACQQHMMCHWQAAVCLGLWGFHKNPHYFRKAGTMASLQVVYLATV